MFNARIWPLITPNKSKLQGGVLQLALIGTFCSFTVLAALKQPMLMPDLPQAVSNNAVALVKSDNQTYLLSFTGLGADKTFQAVHNKAWALALKPTNDSTSTLQSADSHAPKKPQWHAIADVPHVAPLAGRLASIAIGVNDKAYVFGGYTVAENHDEISTIDNYQYSIKTNQYTRIADMPVAVDDTTSTVYQQRYIYLFGGWHNDGNVNLVQVYDTQTNTWGQASPIPAPAVFGQAAAMVGNKLVLCDGVTVKANLNQRRSYQASPVCLFGEIKPDNHLRIDWQLLAHYSVAALTAQASTLKQPPQSLESTEQTATAHYRMAATGIYTPAGGQVVFMGGSDNPYNYSGIGYNEVPSEPSAYSYRFDMATKQWLRPFKLAQPSMDHRGLLCWQNTLIRVGGMLEHQQVSQHTLTTPLNINESCIE